MTVSKKYENAKLGVSLRVAPASFAPEPGAWCQAIVHTLEYDCNDSSKAPMAIMYA